MQKRTELSKSDLKKLLLSYEIGQFKNSKTFTSGTVQTNIFVETTRGKYVLRFYEQDRTTNAIKFEANLINFLKTKKYPCPGVIRNKQGRFLSSFNNKTFVVFEFVDGVHLKRLTSTQKSELISNVAKLQIVSKNYHPLYKKYRWNYNTDLCQKLAKKESNKIGSKNAELKYEWHKKELAKLKLPKSLPKGICHCDFDLSNILFKDGKFNALIDFDDANYTFLAYDLICLVNPFKPSFDHDSWDKFGKDENVFDFSEAKFFVNEYSKHRSLNNNEKRYLFDILKLSILFDCIWFFKRGNVKNFYEKRKIDYLNQLGRNNFYNIIFNND